MTKDPTSGGPRSVASLSDDLEMVESVSERLDRKGVEVLRFSDVSALATGADSLSNTPVVFLQPPSEELSFDFGESGLM